MGSWSAFLHTKFHWFIKPISYHHFLFWQQKQTLLSVNLVNHALLRLISDYQFIGPEGCTLDKPREPQCLET